MPVSRSLRRLFRIRELEEDQGRLALDASLAELRRLELSLDSAAQQGRRGREIMDRGLRTGSLNERIGTENPIEHSENAAPSARPPAGKGQWPSGTNVDSGPSRPEMPAQAAPAARPHGVRPSESDEAKPNARVSNLQDSSANPLPMPGIAPEILHAASGKHIVPGSDRAEIRSQSSNELNSIESNSFVSSRAEESGRGTNSPRSFAPEGSARRSLPFEGPQSNDSLEHGSAREDGLSRKALQDSSAELPSHGNDQLASSSARENLRAPQESSQDAGTAPPSANPSTHRSQTEERRHSATSAKESGAGGASLSTGMGAATGVGSTVTAPHPGSFQAGPRASASVETEQAFDRTDAFKSLDMEGEHPSNPSVHWIHAGAQQAEAGFEDPTLGWVSVRANAGSAGVHPALIPSSAEAAQVLAGHLAGLNTFLANRSQGVGDVTIASPESGTPGMGTQAGSRHGSGEHQRENDAPQANSAISLDAGPGPHPGNATSQQQEPSLDQSASATTLPESGAAYISVMV